MRLFVMIGFMSLITASVHAQTGIPPQPVTPNGTTTRVLPPLHSNIDAEKNDIIREIEAAKALRAPKSELASLKQLEDIDGNIQSVRQRIKQYLQYAEDQRYLSSLLDQIAQKRKFLSELNCNSDIPAFVRTVRDYEYGLYFNLTNFLMNVPSLDIESARLPPPLQTPQEACPVVKALMADDMKNKQFEKFRSDALGIISQESSIQKQLVSSLEELLNGLIGKRKELYDSLGNSPAQKISANLPTILGIFAAACVLAILVIRLFSEDIQMEWVASGQVIQFITVMIILSVVTALALSDILKENTIGTLLGGLAGYVLAQGVGRSAARDLTRAEKAGNSSASTGSRTNGPGSSGQQRPTSGGVTTGNGGVGGAAIPPPGDSAAEPGTKDGTA